MTLSLFLQGAPAWTWKTSVGASLLVVLVWLAQRILGRWLTPSLRYALSLLVLIRLLLPLAPASRFSLENLLTTDQERPALSAVRVDEAAGGPVALRAPVATPTTARHFVLSDVLGLIWGAVCLGLLTGAGWRYRHWSRWVAESAPVTDPMLLDLLESARRTMSVRRPVTLAAVEGLESPAVFGIRRVKLLLPRELLGKLNEEEWRMIFLHEMAHVRRNDVPLNWLLIGVQSLHWFNPLVWLAFQRLRADRELVCDAMVMGRVRAEEHRRYGEVLLKLADGFWADHWLFPSAVPVVGSKQEIKRRIMMIKNPSRFSVAGFAATAVVAAALGGATFTRAQPNSSTPPVPLTPGPAIQVDATPYDLGTIRAGDILSHTFIVTNSGGQALEISRVQPSCGCTTTGSFTRRIEPGATGTIPIQFNSAHKSGLVTKSIQIFSNAKNQARAVVNFRCLVTKGAGTTSGASFSASGSASSSGLSTGLGTSYAFASPSASASSTGLSTGLGTSQASCSASGSTSSGLNISAFGDVALGIHIDNETAVVSIGHHALTFAPPRLLLDGKPQGAIPPSVSAFKVLCQNGQLTVEGNGASILSARLEQ